MARFISINEILHRGRFAEKKEQDSKSPIVTDVPVKEEVDPVTVIETPEDIEPTIQDTPVADIVEVTETPEDVEPTIQDIPEEANVAEAAPVVEEEVAPKKKGGKKTKTTEEDN